MSARNRERAKVSKARREESAARDYRDASALGITVQDVQRRRGELRRQAFEAEHPAPSYDKPRISIARVVQMLKAGAASRDEIQKKTVVVGG